MLSGLYVYQRLKALHLLRRTLENCGAELESDAMGLQFHVCQWHSVNKYCVSLKRRFATRTLTLC